MKKIIAFVLVVVMCLAITACGNSRYQDLIDALDDKDYEQAYAELIKLYQEDKENGDLWGDDEEEADPEVEAFKARANGEWMPDPYYVESNGLASLTLNEDSTAKYGDKTYSWEFEYAYSDSASIILKDGETEAYEIYLNINSNGLINISFSKVTGEGTSSHLGNLYKTSDYTAIEITAENFFDYFELKEVSSISKDAFGEPTSIYVSRYYVFKEECGKVNGDLSNVAVEYSYRSQDVMISADLTTGEYHLGEVVSYNAESEPRTNTTSMGNLYISEDNNPYGMSFDSYGIYEFPVYEAYMYTDFAIVRLAGTIYTYTPAN